MTISKSLFTQFTRAFALSLCTALLLSFVSCSDSTTSQDPKVKIILDANGGSFSETTETTHTLLIKKNQKSKLSTTDELGLSRENHNFKGWAKSQQGTVEFNDGADITSSTDLTLYAQWEAVNSTYTVKHLLQNLADNNYTEDEESIEQKTGTYGTQTAASAKTFEGFTANPFEQETIQADGSTVVEIKYDRKTYTISYSSEYGDTPKAKTVKYGYKLTAADLPDLTQTNYTFNGWLIDGASIPEGYKVKTDINLTALWDEIIANYTVKHLLQNLQDDSYTEDSTEQKPGKSGTKTSAAAKSYEGFTAQTFAQKTIQADGSTVVEIYYDRNTYTISYSSTYGDTPKAKTVKYGYVLTAADLPVLPDTVLSFNGWLFDGASIVAGYTVITDITLTALWKVAASTYFVTKENTSEVIAALTEDSTIVVTGELTESDLTLIADAIKDFTYNVNLDLSQTTELTSILDLTFRDCSKLSGITIPESVTYIGDNAFCDCSSLSSVTIPDSVTSIGVSAFSNCTSLSSVTIPDSVTSIGVSAFSNCTSLSSVTIPDSVTSIGAGAFGDCTSLSSVTIPDSVTSIEQSAFEGCTSLSSVTIPDSVTSISSDSAFYGCTSLESIIVDSNNANYSSIDGVLFNKDASTLLKYPENKPSATYTIPYSVIFIEIRAFSGCTSLSSLTIPNSVHSIGDHAFSCCTSLSSVTIPDSLTSIGWYAFYGCTSLSSIAIPESITSIDPNAFDSCTSLSSVTIGDSVTSICTEAFRGCTSLSSVNIPDTVTSIGGNVFGGCISLTNISVDSNNANYSSIDGVLFNKDATALILYPAGKQSAAYTIPDSVTSIGSFAFYDCTSLSSVTIGNSVTSICYYAFDGCSKLTSISFIDTTTWYRTTSDNNWNNKTKGTLTDVSDQATNATYFKDTYKYYYWYKLDE